MGSTMEMGPTVLAGRAQDREHAGYAGWLCLPVFLLAAMARLLQLSDVTSAWLQFIEANGEGLKKTKRPGTMKEDCIPI